MGITLWITLGLVAAVLFCAFLAIRAWNRPKVEAEDTKQAQEVTKRRQRWFDFREDRRKDWQQNGLFGWRNRRAKGKRTSLRQYDRRD